LLLLVACAAPAPTPTPGPEEVVELEPRVVADGSVLPARSAELRFAMFGTVAELFVAVGDTVYSGAPLARLDSAELEATLDRARTALDEAEARARQIVGDVTDADLQAARAELDEARALANLPAVVLADEPTGNLDSKNTAEIMGLLRRLNSEQGLTLVIVTHNSEVAAATERVIMIRDGRIQRDVPLSVELERALRELKSSALGQAILRGDGLPPELDALAPGLHELMQRA
jgi:multidrug efflux pump subunit AcrA (membrane-fusion protein)